MAASIPTIIYVNYYLCFNCGTFIILHRIYEVLFCDESVDEFVMVYANGFYASTNNRSVKFAMLNDNNNNYYTCKY